MNFRQIQILRKMITRVRWRSICKVRSRVASSLCCSCLSCIILASSPEVDPDGAEDEAGLVEEEKTACAEVAGADEDNELEFGLLREEVGLDG